MKDGLLISLLISEEYTDRLETHGWRVFCIVWDRLKGVRINKTQAWSSWSQSCCRPVSRLSACLRVCVSRQSKGGSCWAAGGEVMARLKSRSKSLSQRDIKVLVFHTHAASFHKESLYLVAAAVQPALKDEMMPTQLDPSTGDSVYQCLKDMILAIAVCSLVLWFSSNDMNVMLHNSHEVSRKKRNDRGNCIHICSYLPFMQFSGFNHCLCDLWCTMWVGEAAAGGLVKEVVSSVWLRVRHCSWAQISCVFSEHTEWCHLLCVRFFFVQIFCVTYFSNGWLSHPQKTVGLY